MEQPIGGPGDVPVAVGHDERIPVLQRIEALWDPGLLDVPPFDGGRV